jgi:hypothetical protein
MKLWLKHWLYFHRYGWGWEIGSFGFGWWLVYSQCDRPTLYVSNDATPPNRDFNKGWVLWRRRVRGANLNRVQ